VRLEYFEEAEPRLLLAYGDDPGDATALRRAADELAAGEVGHCVRIDQLRGFHSVNGCSLTAATGSVDRGVESVDASGFQFRCALRAASWQRVSGLLEPFESEQPEPRRATFQYLDESGPVLWIISTDRAW
jgi:hypothetical protein